MLKKTQVRLMQNVLAFSQGKNPGLKKRMKFPKYQINTLSMRPHIQP